jgi:hypothetical protein
MRIWRVDGLSASDNACYVLWFETKEAAEHAAKKWNGVLRQLKIGQVRVPAESRRDFVRWLNTHFPAKKMG